MKWTTKLPGIPEPGELIPYWTREVNGDVCLNVEVVFLQVLNNDTLVSDSCNQEWWMDFFVRDTEPGYVREWSDGPIPEPEEV